MSETPRALGVSRLADNANALLVSFERELSDDELRDLHDQLAGRSRPSWTCFHCGETFTLISQARIHFGFDPAAEPGCRIKNGAEKGLLIALRDAEHELGELRARLENDSTESAQLYAAQQARHRHQLMAAEEAGYDRGLADGRRRRN